jgi:enoyl-CoA hydratase/carnithine racemase
MADVVTILRDDDIATVLLNRPEAFNAFNMELAERFAADLITLAADREVRGVIISGQGKAFCAGGDLKWALAFPQGPAAAFHVLAAGSLHSFGWSKRLLTDSFNSSFETHIERERRGLSSCAAHPEGREGLRAFAEKRKPQFKPGSQEHMA